MTDRPQTIGFYRKRLPHWEVADGRYFVTFRLVGSLPAHVAEEIRSLLATAGKQTDEERTRTQRRIFRDMETWLDRASPVDWLSRPGVPEAISQAVQHYANAGRWAMTAFVVMPSHLHLFCRPTRDRLSDTLKSFKHWTAVEANRILGRKGKRFWQREWFDHWSRSAQEDDRIASYIRNNPVKAGLVKRAEDWPWGSG